MVDLVEVRRWEEGMQGKCTTESISYCYAKSHPKLSGIIQQLIFISPQPMVPLGSSATLNHS